MAEINLPDNGVGFFAMTSEPLKGCTPDKMREILKRNDTDEVLAAVMAAVSNEAGWLGHDTDDPDNDEETILRIIAEFDAWWELEKELFDEIVRRLEAENGTKGTAYRTGGIRMHKIIKPFMERNGYRDGAGWWVAAE